MAITVHLIEYTHVLYFNLASYNASLLSYTASINCCKKNSIAMITQLRSLKLLIAKLLYCILYTVWIDWLMSFGLEQEGGSLISPMALAHPLHPIDSRSKNRRRNLWVGWCVSSWWPLFPSRISVYIYYVCIFYMGSSVNQLHPITFYRTVFLGCARFLGWMLLFVFFGLPIVSCSMINSLILGCLWPLVFILNYILILGIWHSAISHLPGYFVPGTSFRISDSTWYHRTPLCHI